MLRIAGPEEDPVHTGIDLGRFLHPSSGLPRRLVLALMDDAAADPVAAPVEERLAEVVPIDVARRRSRRRGVS